MSHWYDSTPEKSRRKRDSNPGPSALEADALTTRPTRRWGGGVRKREKEMGGKKTQNDKKLERREQQIEQLRSMDRKNKGKQRKR